MKNQPSPQDLQREKDRAALTDGISDEALAVLKRHFQSGLPVFQFREGNAPIQADAQTLTLMAATRDGNHEVIQYIEAMRKLPPLIIKPTKPTNPDNE